MDPCADDPACGILAPEPPRPAPDSRPLAWERFECRRHHKLAEVAGHWVRIWCRDCKEWHSYRIA